MARRPVFDFGLGQTPRVREKEEWLEVATDSRALGAAALENACVLALDHVEPGPWQVRREFHAEKMAELVESVRAQGVLEPILVRAAAEGRYSIVAGERRYRAAKEAGLTTIPALVLDIGEQDARVISLMENIQRDDLNEVERAEGLLALKMLTGQTWEEVGRLLGISKRHVLHLVSLTRLPGPVQELVRAGRLSAKHGRLLAYVKDPEVQCALAECVAELRLNAHQTAEAVKRLGSEPGFTGLKSERGSDPRDRIWEIVSALAEKSDLPVAVVGEIAGGELGALLEGVTVVRRAIAAFPSGRAQGADARRLRTELGALIQAAQALLDRVPVPPANDSEE